MNSLFNLMIFLSKQHNQRDTNSKKKKKLKSTGLYFSTIPTIFPKVRSISISHNFSRIAKAQMTMQEESLQIGLFSLSQATRSVTIVDILWTTIHNYALENEQVNQIFK